MASPTTSVAPVTLAINHPNEPLTLNDVDQRDLTLRQVLDFVEGMVSGARGAVGSSFDLSYGSARASGTITLASALGVAASGTVTLGGGAGNVTITVGGTAVGPVVFDTSDIVTATACVTALNANPTVAALITASNVGGTSAVITLTADAKGTAGNAITLTSSRTAGTATASGATFAGGLQAVTATVGGTAVSVATEGVTDTATATSLAAALVANGTIAALVDVTQAAKVVTLTAKAFGTSGNSITLVSTAGAGSATASGATLAGGAASSTKTYTR
jgi:phage tail sheath gpL-like